MLPQSLVLLPVTVTGTVGGTVLKVSESPVIDVPISTAAQKPLATDATTVQQASASAWLKPPNCHSSAFIYVSSTDSSLHIVQAEA